MAGYWENWGRQRIALLESDERDTFIDWVTYEGNLRSYMELPPDRIVRLFRQRRIPPEYQVDEGL